LAFRNQSLISVIKEVAESCKVTGTSLNTYDGSKYTTCVSANSFKVGDVVFFGAVSFLITTVTDSQFIVNGDASGLTSYTSGGPYVEYGHMVEISNTLKARNTATGTLQYQKYPLIALKLDVESDYIGQGNTFNYSDISIFLVNITDKTYKAKDRLEKNFDPVLYPLYEKFITALKRHPSIRITNELDNTKHSKIDRFFWGSQDNDNSTKNIFNDYLDAIEIRNLELSINNKKCKK
jgi:hypothetical protein